MDISFSDFIEIRATLNQSNFYHRISNMNFKLFAITLFNLNSLLSVQLELKFRNYSSLAKGLKIISEEVAINYSNILNFISVDNSHAINDFRDEFVGSLMNDFKFRM